VDTEVARTLAELERKLGDLERALSGAPRQEPSGGLAGGARLVDERLEGLGSASAPQAPGPPPAPSSPPAAGPPPAQAPTPPPPAPTPGPATASPSFSQHSDESIELAELARYRDRLEQTMRDLLTDYERVIRLRSLSASWPPVDRT
jgi:hypothetical protein